MVRISYYRGFDLYDAKARSKEEAIEILVQELGVESARISFLRDRAITISQKKYSKTIDFDGMVEDMGFIVRIASLFWVLCGVRYCADPLTGRALRFIRGLPESKIKAHFISRSQNFEAPVICEQEAAKFALIFAKGVTCPVACENLANLPMGLLLNTVLVAESNHIPLEHFIT